jgi:Spy/CpxP family protein refolding chaperone
MHVLELKDRLQLSPEQERAMQRLQDAMFGKSRPAAVRLLAAERRLRAVFAAGTANETAVRAAVTDAERTRTELRVVHLLAHLETRDLPSVEQRRLYHTIRWP